MTDAIGSPLPRTARDHTRALDQRVRDALDVLARELETVRSDEDVQSAEALTARLTHAVASIHTSWKVLEKLSRTGWNPAMPNAAHTSLKPVIWRAPRYQLGERLGVGGMAEVFRGWQIGAAGFERPVAIKRILPKLAHDNRYRVMFTEEAHILARLTHPNIVGALDFVNDNDEPLLVLEHVDGVDLCKLIGSGPVPPSVTMFIAAELLSGLGYAHDVPGNARGWLGVVHCDLSPTNVLLSWDGAVKISDFGIAKLCSPTKLPISRGREGKAGYMSPEQRHRQPLDGRADLFSLGVILWELLVGERLFPHEQPSITAERLNAHRLPRPSELRAVPRDLERVVMKLLRRRCERRYRTAEEALDAVAKCGGASTLRGRVELVELLVRRFPEETTQRLTKRPPLPHTPTPAIPLSKGE